MDYRPVPGRTASTAGPFLDPRDVRIAELEARCEQLIEDNALTQIEFGNRIARLRLAFGRLLATHGGLDDLIDVLENDVHEQRSAGLPYEAEQALLDALADVQRNRDLEG